MTYIAQIVVIEQNHFHRRFLLHNSSQLLQIHLQTAVAHKYAYRTVGNGKRRSYGSRKSKSHRSQPPRCNDAAIAGIPEITRRHHLVLPHIGNQNRFIASGIAHGTYHFSHIERPSGRIHFRFYDLRSFFFGIRSKRIDPLLVFCRYKQICYRTERFLTISKNRNIGFHVFVYFGRIYIKMYDFGLFGIRTEIAGYPVVKTHTYGDQDITFVGLHIRSQITVHTEHTHIQIMFRGQRR